MDNLQGVWSTRTGLPDFLATLWYHSYLHTVKTWARPAKKASQPMILVRTAYGGASTRTGPSEAFPTDYAGNMVYGKATASRTGI